MNRKKVPGTPSGGCGLEKGNQQKPFLFENATVKPNALYAK